MSTVIPGFVKQGGDNLVRNVTGMWDGMRPRDYIRIILVVGGYLLIRPYLLKLAAKIQAKEFAKYSEKIKLQERSSKISPNELRDGGRMKVEKSGHEVVENEVITNGAEWGENARRRQQKQENNVTKKQTQEGSDSEKDKINILDYLVDYEEGKEGW